jgi:hypothetical protein
MPTRHPRIQVTVDPELSRRPPRGRAAPSGGPCRACGRCASSQSPARVMSRNGPRSEEERRELLEGLLAMFDDPESAGIDLHVLRDNRRAWPLDR